MISASAADKGTLGVPAGAGAGLADEDEADEDAAAVEALLELLAAGA